jgi:hypothetical protein
MGFLSSVNWDALSKGINTIGTGAQVISQTINTLNPSKVAGATTTAPTQYTSQNSVAGNSGGLLAAVGLLAILLLKK